MRCFYHDLHSARLLQNKSCNRLSVCIAAHVVTWVHPWRRMIQNMMERKFVPTKMIVELLDKAMEESGNGTFLIDGFPCSLDNLKCCRVWLALAHNSSCSLIALKKRWRSQGAFWTFPHGKRGGFPTMNIPTLERFPLFGREFLHFSHTKRELGQDGINRPCERCLNHNQVWVCLRTFFNHALCVILCGQVQSLLSVSIHKVDWLSKQVSWMQFLNCNEEMRFVNAGPVLKGFVGIWVFF